MSVRASLQAVIDDDKASDEDKEDAKKALAALDEEKDDKAEGDEDEGDEAPPKKDDKAEDEGEGDEAAAAPGTAASAAPTNAEARLAALEADVAHGKDTAKRRKLFAARADLSKAQIASLKSVPTVALAAALAAIPVAAAAAPKGPNLTQAAVAAVKTEPGATEGEPQFSDARKKQRQRMGLMAVTGEAIKVEETKFSFSVHQYAQNGGKVSAK